MNTITETQNRQSAIRQPQNERGFVTPPANIVGNTNEYVVELEMPGVDKEGIEVTTEGNELTIIGRRKSQLPEGDLCYCESAQANYRRVFEIGPDVDTSKIVAGMRQGVLTLRLPKSEKAKPKKVEVKVG